MLFRSNVFYLEDRLRARLHLVEILAADILYQDSFILSSYVLVLHLFQMSFRCYIPI